MSSRVSGSLLAIFMCSLMLCALGLSSCQRSSPQAKAAKFKDRGKLLMQKKEFTRAILEFKSATQAMPRDAEAYYQLGLAALALSDYRLGAASLKKATELDPKHAGAQLKLAELFIATGDKDLLNNAESMMAGLLQESPDNPEVLNNLGLVEWKLGRKQEAQEHWEEVLQKFPQNAQAAGMLARLKLMTNDTAGAEAILKKLVVENPKNVDAIVALAEFYVIAKRPDAAEPHFRQALALSPQNSIALVDLAFLLGGQDRKVEAEALYKQLSTLPDTRFQHMYAMYLYAHGKYDAAMSELQRLTRAYPDNRAARIRLAQGWLLGGKIEEAEKVLNAALKKNPKEVPALLQRSRILLYRKKYMEAQADLGSVLQFEPGSADAHYLLSKVYAARGSSLSQRQELDVALKADPSLLAARLDLAQLLSASGNSKMALEVLDNAPSAQKNVKEFIVQRNWVVMALGDVVQSQKTVQEGLKVSRDPDFLLQDAVLKLKQAKYPEASASLEEELKIRPEDTRALVLLVRSYMVQKRNDAASRALNNQVEKFPNSAPLRTLWAHWQLASGKHAEAREALSIAMKSDGGYAPAALALARIEFDEGRLGEAGTALEKLSSKDGTWQGVVRLTLGDIKRAQGQSAAALELYRSVADTEPGNVGALNNTAYFMADLGGNLDEALKYAQRAKELAPELASVDDTLGWVLYKKGMYGAAVPHFAAAASADATGVTDYHLGMAHLKLGDKAASSKALNVALTKNPKLEPAQRALADLQP